VTGAPHIEDLYQEYAAGGHVYFLSSYDWDTYFAGSVEITYPWSEDMDWMEQQGYMTGSHPVYALIGDDNVLLHKHWHRPDEAMIDDALDTYLDIFVQNPVEDFDIGSGESTIIDLTETFANEQGLPIESVTVVQNTNPNLITTNIENFELTIAASSSVGNSTIGLLGECNGEQISDSFQIQVYDSNVVVVFLEDFETGNSFNGTPNGWVLETSPTFNYFPFYCMNDNSPQNGNAPHSGDWYMFFDNHYSGHPSGQAEGWMFQQVQLEADTDYRVSLWAITDQESDQYDVQAWIGSDSNSGSMNIEVIPEIYPGIQEHLESAGEFSVPTSGTYYLGIYGLQYGDDNLSNILAIDDIAIVEVTPPILGSLRGSVTDSESIPLHNAEINVNNMFTTSTDENGDYEINLPIGIYMIECSAEGYDVEVAEDIEIIQNEITDLNFILNPLVDVEEKICLPISSSQIYPNPFNPNTTISFSLLNEGNTNINIYNMKGQKIVQFVDENLSAGKHSFMWNGLDDEKNPISSGIYFFEVKSDNYSKIMKGLLLK
jgi:Carboxypeptidase regulatory-like domain/Secretion system C-terminal sorting domain